MSTNNNLKNMSPQEKRNILEKALQQQEAQKKALNKRAEDHLKKSILPTPQEIVVIINSNVTGREALLSNHPFWVERKIRAGLNNIISVAHASYVDICRHQAALVSLSTNSKTFQETVEREVEIPLNKDVMAFCTTAHACIDTVRRLKKARQDIAPQIDQAIADHLTGNSFEFVKGLRKNISHGSVIMANWTLRSDRNGHSGAMVFDAEDLIRFGEWNAGAKAYIAACEEGKIDTVVAMGEYNEGLLKFSSALDDLLAISRTPAEIDYYNIEDSNKRKKAGQWTYMAVTQIAKGKDPYKYLHRHFSQEEYREIMRLPSHSKEQVDLMISMKKMEIECTPQLREALYSLFAVPPTQA